MSYKSNVSRDSTTKTLNEDLQATVSARHTHSNKSVLDGITSDKVAQWDAGGADVSGKEDKSNKVTALNDASTNDKYPGAKAVVDYVKQKAAEIYDFQGSTDLYVLPNASTLGKGKVYNMLDEGSKTFNESGEFGTATYSSGYITFPFALPGNGFISVTVTEPSATKNYTLTSLYKSGDYSYKDGANVLYEYDYGTTTFIVTSLSYTLSVNVGDNVVSTGYYWDNFGAYIDMSTYMSHSEFPDLLANQLASDRIEIPYLQSDYMFLAKEIYSKSKDWSKIYAQDPETGNSVNLQETLATKSDDMKLLNSFTFEEEAGSVEFTATDDGVSYSNLSLRKIYVFTNTSNESTTTSTTHISVKFPEHTSVYSIGNSIGAAQIANATQYFSIMFVDFTKRLVLQTTSGVKNGYGAALQYHSSLAGNASSIGANIKNIADPTIELIKWSAVTSGVNIPSNSKIEIWGCA